MGKLNRNIVDTTMRTSHLLAILLLGFLSESVLCSEDSSESFEGDGQVEEDPQDDSGDAGQEESQEDLPIIPHPDLKTSIHFPMYPDMRIALGKKVDMLVGITNTGDKTFNISMMFANLNSPFDYS